MKPKTPTRRSVSRTPTKTKPTAKSKNYRAKLAGNRSRNPIRNLSTTKSNKAIQQVSMKSQVKRYKGNIKVKQKIKEEILGEFIKKKNKYLLNKRPRGRKDKGSSGKTGPMNVKSTQKLRGKLAQKSARKPRRPKMASTMNLTPNKKSRGYSNVKKSANLNVYSTCFMLLNVHHYSSYLLIVFRCFY